MSFVRGLQCRECGQEYPKEPLHVCETCFGPLEIVYDYDGIKKSISREKIASRDRNLWRYRELLYFLAWRDILVRYKQTVVGVTWAVIRPLLTMIVLTIVFGRLAGMPSGGVPYPILVFCGMLPWQFFSTAGSETSNSLVGNSSLISKVYFPRMTIPASSVITSFVDFAISAGLLAILMIWYQYVPTVRLDRARKFELRIASFSGFEKGEDPAGLRHQIVLIFRKHLGI